MRSIRLRFLVPLFLLVAACEEVIDTPGTNDFEPILVIEAVFTNEEKIQTVQISQSVPLNFDGEPSPVSAATVTISDENGTITLAERILGSGIYETSVPVKGETGRRYRLDIEVDGRTYSAVDVMDPVDSLAPITYFTAKDNQAMYEWSVPKLHSLAPGRTFEWQVTFARPSGPTDEVTYYNFTGLETTALVALNQISQSIRFQAGTKIIQRKLSLSGAYYDFLKAMYTETDWKGGLYDVSPANIPTNLSGGATGFFRTASVVSMEQEVK